MEALHDTLRPSLADCCRVRSRPSAGIGGQGLKIAVVAACPLPWPRGTPIRIHRMAEALVNRGHAVDVVTYGLGDPTISSPYSLHRVGRPGRGTESQPGPTLRKLLWLDPQLVARLTGLLRSRDYDVI